MNLRSRYPGPIPFQTGQSRIFYGRQVDADKLLRQVLLKPMVVLHAKSGLGKSSLINAGLIPKIQDKANLDFREIRFQAYNSEPGAENLSPLETCLKALSGTHPLLEKIKPVGPISLWHVLKAMQLSSEVPRQEFLLIFDQFEELFSYPPSDRVAFAKSLSEALTTTLPAAYRERRRAGFEHDAEFLSEDELELLDQPLPLRVLFSVRSDRLSLLKELKEYLPGILTNDYELRPLSRPQAEDAIFSPALQQGDFESPVFDYSEDAITFLLDYLSAGEFNFIESYQLQIICEHLEQEVIIGQKRTKIELSDLEDPEKILAEYYWNKILAIDDPADQLAARRLIEEGMIFENEERRLPVYEGQILTQYGVSPALLHRLLDTHIIRSEPSLRGGYTYELSHDTLVRPVLEAKRERLKQEREEQEQREQAEKLAALEKEAAHEKQLRREAQERAEKLVKSRTLITTLLMGVGFLAATIITFLFLQSQQDAEELRKATKDLKEESKRLEIAVYQRDSLEAADAIRKARVYLRVDEYPLAVKQWEKAMALDSTSTYLQDSIAKYKPRQ